MALFTVGISSESTNNQMCADRGLGFYCICYVDIASVIQSYGMTFPVHEDTARGQPAERSCGEARTPRILDICALHNVVWSP